MMKKEYINPEMVVVKITTQMMLATSPTVPTGDTPTPADDSDAPELNMFGF